MVFNNFDNMCSICNLKICFITNNDEFEFLDVTTISMFFINIIYGRIKIFKLFMGRIFK